MNTTHRNAVTDTPAADAPLAFAHFQRRLQVETDCWDVHSTQGHEPRGFVLLDVRARAAFERGHLPGALCLPGSEIEAERLTNHDDATLFVVYCAGPHCNGAHRAAVRLAELGRRVKVMIGGVTGWKDEGFELVSE